MTALVPNEYPTEAVEVTVTVLIPVTEENRADVNRQVVDALNAAGLLWWVNRLDHVIEGHGTVLSYTYNRPPGLVKHKAPRRVRAAS